MATKLSLTVRNKAISTVQITNIVEGMLELSRDYASCMDAVISVGGSNTVLDTLKEDAIHQIINACAQLDVPMHETVAVVDRIINGQGPITVM